MDTVGGRLSAYEMERMSEKRFGQLIEAARPGFADGTMAGL